MGITEQTFDTRKRTQAGPGLSDLRQLRSENMKLKWWVADQSLMGEKVGAFLEPVVPRAGTSPGITV